ncbi:transposase [Endozoicomonas ascidiicola]|uniref:transposase n=1 Tax=Endozoicomonas ascidiicola TaxID=1698521 RepID=UPI00082F6568|nr:transposase [Endozoicomonas ascidiicola]
MGTGIKKNIRHFSASYLIKTVSDCFENIPDHRPNKSRIPFGNFPKSAFAVMHQKFDSLLGFDEERLEPTCCHNLEKLYHVKEGKVPSDTRMREVLDPIDPIEFKKPFKELFSVVQRNGALQGYAFNCGKLKDHYLLPIDGTGLFYSDTSRCADCCVKNEGKKNETYYHNIMGGCLAHPNKKTVIPLAPEAICRQDGSTKNDCEKAAIRRFLAQVKKDHPRLQLVILLDGLYADNPTVAMIREFGWHYIIVAKDGNHVALIEAMNALYDQGEVHHHTVADAPNKTTHKFRYANNVPLNLQDETEHVNVLDYIEIDKKGIQHFWCWITDIELTNDTVESVMRGGRCRWRIENETFNTLKNQGYQLEHSYGHGEKHLATNFAYLTFLAFLVDQIQELACPKFQQTLNKPKKPTRKRLWRKITSFFLTLRIDSWGSLFRAISHGSNAQDIAFDSS